MTFSTTYYRGSLHPDFVFTGTVDSVVGQSSRVICFATRLFVGMGVTLSIIIAFDIPFSFMIVK